MYRLVTSIKLYINRFYIYCNKKIVFESYFLRSCSCKKKISTIINSEEVYLYYP